MSPPHGPQAAAGRLCDRSLAIDSLAMMHTIAASRSAHQGAAMAMAMWSRDRLYLAVLHGGPPTDDEWGRWIALGAPRKGLEQRVLVEARGSGPSAKQRRTIASENTPNVRIAIMTDSPFVRGIVTAVGWFGVSLRAFPLSDHASAGRFLELTADELVTVREVLPSLRVEAGVPASS